MQGKPNAAIADLQRVIQYRKERLAAAPDLERRSSLALAHYELALVLRDLHRSAEAEKAFTEALLLREDLYRAGDRTPLFLRSLAANHREIGMLHDDAGRNAEAEQRYLRAREIGEQIVQVDPREPEHGEALAQTCVRLAWLWERMGRADDARTAYLRAVKAGPVLPGSCNDVAWWLATCSDERDRNPRHALQLAKQAVAKEPASSSFWNTLGVAHYRNGDNQAAIAALEKAMSLPGGSHAFNGFFLAMAHGRSGDRDKARTWFNRAVQWMDEQMPHNGELRRFRAEAEAMLAEAGKP
jgi:tetratricopeptide (TPR) repeat protein